MPIQTTPTDKLYALASLIGAEVTYGNPIVIDPHHYAPDEEVCTEAEIARWMAACLAWDRSDDVTIPYDTLLYNGDGSLVAHFASSGWGKGTSVLFEETAVLGQRPPHTNVWPDGRIEIVHGGDYVVRAADRPTEWTPLAFRENDADTTG